MDNNLNETTDSQSQTSDGLVCQNDANNHTMQVGLVENSSDYDNIPRVGMQFSTDEEAYKFYNAFAQKRGFGVRKSNSSKSPSGEIIRRVLVCAKEGFKSINDKREIGKEVKRRKDLREGCRARITFVKSNDGFWHIKSFSDDHNHEMSPLLDAETLRSQITGQLSQQSSHGLRVRRKSNTGRECMFLLQEFIRRQAVDNKFYYDVELDDVDCVCRNIFWADGRARSAYLNFSDVVLFDVSCKISNNKIPFAVFTGVNHHRKSTLFACALLADEEEDTFVWLFRNLLTCMLGKAPSAIITNQNNAICSAIERVFPDTSHRYCTHQIVKLEDENLYLLRHSFNPSFDVDYMNWSRNSRTIEESEECWMTLNERYSRKFKEPLTGTQKNELMSWKWLENMYEKRHYWVEAYLNAKFFAGMKSCHQSDSTSSFFDGYIHCMISMHEFVGLYDSSVATRHEEEEREDTHCMTAKLDPQNMHDMEAYAAKVYTRNMFQIFHEEFHSVFYCKHDIISTEEGITVYVVVCKIGGKSVSHTVRSNASDKLIKCSCSKFENEGMLCMHILYVMKQVMFMQIIPTNYILSRWTLDTRYSSRNNGLDDASLFLRGTTNRVVTPLETWNLRAKLNRLLELTGYDRSLYTIVDETAVKLLQQYDLAREREPRS